jgi:hypothetical protein
MVLFCDIVIRRSDHPLTAVNQTWYTSSGHQSKYPRGPKHGFENRGTPPLVKCTYQRMLTCPWALGRSLHSLGGDGSEDNFWWVKWWMLLIIDKRFR